MHKLGIGLVIGGGALQIIQGFSQADAVLNNIPYQQTALGTFMVPVEDTLHIPSGMSGWFLVGAGLLILLIPKVVGK